MKDKGAVPPEMARGGSTEPLSPAVARPGAAAKAKPLAGQRIVVTRSREQAGAFSARLRDAGAQVFEVPVIKQAPPDDKEALADALLGLHEYDWLVFTSVNGVRWFFDYFFKAFEDLRDLGGVRIAAVGPVTAARLKELHLAVDAMPDEALGKKVARAMAAHGSIENLRVCLLRAQAANAELPRLLEEAGAIVDDIACYKTVVETEDPEGTAGRLREAGADWITFTSGSTVEHFHARFDLPALLRRFPAMRLASIGPETSQALAALSLKPDVEARTHTTEGLLKAMEHAKRKTTKAAQALLVTAALLLPLVEAEAGTLLGHVRDPNWYAQYQANPPGVGYYEYAVNANGTNLSSLGGLDDTDVFGAFQMANLAAGTYTVASWDVWWRSAFAFNVPVPASGSTPDVDVRLHATMWGYPAFWEETGWHEFGQTFEASGPVTMIYLRDPLGSNFTRRITVHENGPGGSQIGVTRTYGGGGDQRLVYGLGDMPTIQGRTYYLRLRSPSPATGAVINQMDPRPDFSDPMPGGCLYLGDGTTLTPHPDRDLGVVIMSDDDGLITDLFARSSGPAFSGVTSVGQTFVAQGVNLISAAFWLADPSAPTYLVRVRQNGPGGAQVGTSKRGKPARLFADPEMIVVWAPGECPLTAGATYYIEVTRDGGGVFNSVYANNSNPFGLGQAHTNGVALPGSDLAGTIMEEQSLGSATRRPVQFTSYPTVTEPNCGINELTITWTTDVASDSLVEYALDAPPYTGSRFVATPTTQHTVTLTGLQSHGLYHYRVSSRAPDLRPGVSRDLVVCTKPAATNLLANPGFEEGSGAGPSRLLTGWTAGGSLDLKGANGSWFGSLPPRTGGWFLQGALNGGSSDGYVYQRISNAVPGRAYTFSAWVGTWPIENGFKYDVWQDRGRLIYVRLGLDPTGGTNPTGPAVRWTPRFYSHKHYTDVAKSAVAQSSNLTVFVHMKGDLAYGNSPWHLYAVDDCALSSEGPAPALGFESEPAWDSSFDAPPGASASFTVLSPGQSGNALVCSRSEAGASARVLLFSLQTNTTYLVALWGNCPSSPSNYCALAAVQAGAATAQGLVEDPMAWTRLAEFGNPGQNGNSAQWRQYFSLVSSGSNTQLSVGFLLASTNGGSPSVRWDTLRLEPFVLPAPTEALADRASNTISVRFSHPVFASAATNPANYHVATPDGAVVLAVLRAEVTASNEVLLTTAPREPSLDFLLTVSNVVDTSQAPGQTFVNGPVAVRAFYSLLALNDVTLWKFNASGADQGAAWRELDFDDSTWPAGAPLFGEENCNCLPEPLRTRLSLRTNLTFYFRHRFTAPAGVTNPPLLLRHVVDDGAVFYLNGVEIHRRGMTNPITSSTPAQRTVDNAVYEGPFALTVTNLFPGANVLAVEVHQVSRTSPDLVFGARLDTLLLPSQMPPGNVRMSVTRQGDRVIADWSAPGWTLQRATNLAGPWLPAPTPGPPHTNLIQGQAEYYRLRDYRPTGP